MDKTPVTKQLADFFTSLSSDNVSFGVRESAHNLLLDTLSCLRAGASVQASRKVIAVSNVFGGPGKASMAGSLDPQGASRALYANARLSNLLDWDETYPVGVHFGIGAVCAAMTAAEAENRSGADLVAGIIAGYEAGGRLASAIGPMMSVEDGQVTGFSEIWGVAAPVVVASCVAYARTIGLDSDSLQMALGISCSNIPLPIGSRWSEALHLPDNKYCDSGWCAVTGMHGVISAREGLTGFEGILDGAVGIPEMYAAAMPRRESMAEGLGSVWHLDAITYKPWPTCRFMHSPMTALARLIGEHKPDPDVVDEIVIFTGPLANSSRFRNPRPKTFSSYCFSYHHAVAMMVMGITPGAEWFDSQIAESQTALDLRKKVRIELFEDSRSFAQDMAQGQIRRMPGAASLVVRGQTWTRRSDYADGDPWDQEVAYGRDKLADKLASTARKQDLRKLLDWLKEIETAKSLEPLFAFIRNS
ncbi:hypothetical protein CkaCkLH20_08943 [Colletotrichum karsti]|uniref:MmgE/PrpD family protein n=1 Tax=Colletotrichum karsti TaxID=1095194 RepID=A0A9P6HZG2_9PEZI|nr:uncharacterized protein CkaCkLH20_08943 [Colletotrichum karsti]KAF9873484.1 hypothetical protein CkaCkLH20_08943 [Colletotrichum karsti]